MSRIAIKASVVASSLDSIGYSFEEIYEYLTTAIQPTEGYFYADEVPTTKK